MPYIDPQDPRRAESSRRHYQKNKDAYLDRAKANKRRAVQFVIDSKIGKACMDCGIVYPHFVLDYDHRDASEKRLNLSMMAARSFSNERLAEEIAKCDLVCSNCHRIRTAERGGWHGRSDSN